MDTLLFRILCVLAFLLNFAACSSSNNADSTGTSTAIDLDADPDNDGLSNDLELNTYRTNINVADTDGDGISDGDEVNELGFNPASNLYRFNPLIADLPVIGVNIDTVPDLVLRYRDSAGTETSVSNSNGGSRVETDTRSYTGGVSVTLGTEIGLEVGLFGGAESKVTASVTGSYSTTEQETTENQENWETVTENSSSTNRETDSASLRIGVSIENVSNLSYSLEHITLVASYLDGNQLKPIATLGYDNAGGGFQRTSFSPGEKSNTLLFSFDNLDLGTALDVLKDARSLVVEPALYELTDAGGKAIDFNKGEVNAKTAFVLLDYGVVRPQEQYRVSILNSLADGSLDVAAVLSQILNVDYQASSGLDTVRGIGGDPDSRWVMVLTHNDGFIDNTTVYDPDAAAYDLAQINLFPGDSISIIYLTDVDGDGIGLREEFLNGTDPNNADTDGDGLTDDIEIRNTVLVNATNLIDPNRYPAKVKSNPVLADADGDLLNDKEEIERGLDPNNSDTDGDGIGDKIDTFNGQVPIAADFVLTPQGGSSVKLAGTATPKSGTRVTTVSIDWGDGSAADVATSVTNAPLNVNLQHTYPVQLSDTTSYNINIIMTSTDDDPTTSDTTVTHAGSFQLYSESTYAGFDTAVGWSADKNIRTLADMDNDGDLDLVGFGSGGVVVNAWDETSNTFNDAFAFATAGSTWLTGLYGADAAGGNWEKIRHPRYLVDYDADGLTDVLGIGEGAFVWSKNCGDGTLKAASACGDVGNSAVSEQLSNTFTAGSGWDAAKHFRAMADVDGNGLVDLIAAGGGAVFVLRNLGSGATELVTMDENAIETLEQSYGTAFTTNDAGVTNDNAFRMVGDINGDGRADLLLSGGSRMFYALGRIDGSFSTISEICASSDSCFTPAQGWAPDKHLILFEDISNDGLPDLIGFGYGAVLVALNESTQSVVNFGPFNVWSSNYTYNAGWQVGQHLRYLADVNGDGYKDIVGFTGSAVAALNLLPKGQESFSSDAVVLSGNISLGTDWQTVVETTEPDPINPFNTIFVSTYYYNNRLAGDYNNDGYADAVGFSNTGVIGQRSPVIVQPVEQ